jgi:hypothetical protein
VTCFITLDAAKAAGNRAIAAVGQPVAVSGSNGTWTITVTKLDKESSFLLRAANGTVQTSTAAGVYLHIFLTFENTDKSAHVFAGENLTAQDSQGRIYEGISHTGQVDKSVNPGLVGSGDDAIDVPANGKGLVLVGRFGFEDLQIALPDVATVPFR